MGDCQSSDLRVQFDRRLKLKFLGSQITTDAGLLAYRELDEALSRTFLHCRGWLTTEYRYSQRESALGSTTIKI
jgi:hypothetical protein